MAYTPKTLPCDSCGKELLWNVAPWPIETAPRHPESTRSRAYVFLRNGQGYRAVDIRSLPDPPDQVYPQHVCPVWLAKQEQARADRDRTAGVLRRMAGE